MKLYIITIIAIFALTIIASTTAVAAPHVTCDLELNYLNHSESVRNSSPTLNKCFELSFAQSCRDICKKEKSDAVSCNRKCIKSAQIVSATCSTATDSACLDIAQTARKSAQPAPGVSTSSKGLIGSKVKRISPLLAERTQKNRKQNSGFLKPNSSAKPPLLNAPSNKKDENHSNSKKK